MGTINYGTSDYITLGIVPYDTDDFRTDADFMRDIEKHVDEYGGTIESYMQYIISQYYEDDWYNIENELKKHHFYYYHIAIKPGYYEGFYLDIENNFSVAFDSWEDRRAANKEITELKRFLIDCAGLGLVKCSPGWCTGYSDYSGTIAAINEAVKEMREELKNIPTWRQYMREA